MRRNAVKYMLLIYGDMSAADDSAPPDGAYSDWVVATQSLQDDGVLLGGDGLQPVDSATTVRNRGGERIVSDGPFAETKEQLLGYYLVEVPDSETAAEYAGRMPTIGWGSVEVRPLMDSAAAAG